MIDFDYEGVNKEDYTIRDIYALFKRSQEEPHVQFRSKIVEVPLGFDLVVPRQDIRWKKRSSKPVIVDYEELESSRQKELDYTVDMVRALEQKRNVFEKMKELKELDERLKEFANLRKEFKIGGGE